MLAETFRFDDFELDGSAFELRRAGRVVRLERIPLELLLLFVERRGQLVTRGEILERIWGKDVFVDADNGINTAVRKIRLALKDDAETPRFLRTVPAKGYRFIAPVETPAGGQPTTPEVPEGTSPAPEVAAGTFVGVSYPFRQPAEAPRTGYRRRPYARLLVGLAIALPVVIGGAWNIAGLRSPLLGGTRIPRIRSLAVLPLENLSRDPEQDYFADGMTDELITDLAHIGELRVVSRTSVMHYKGTKKTLPEIARELNVDAVVEGSVLREGNRVRISAQLVRASTDTHLWANSYARDLPNVLALQDELAREIAKQITVQLTPSEQAQLARARPVNPEAHELYLKGRFYWNKRTRETLKKSLEYFQQAIEKDPNDALAYAGLADAYAMLGAGEYSVLPRAEAGPKAEAAAIQALRLDDALAEAHTSLAYVKCDSWDYQGAEKEFKRAIELNPGYATAHQWYAECPLVPFGRFSEAIAEIRKAESLDPLSLIISAEVGSVLCQARQYDQAIAQEKKTLEMDPDFAVAHDRLAEVYLTKRMFDEFLAEERKINGGKDPASSAVVAALQGRPDEAIQFIKRMKSRRKQFDEKGSEFDGWIAGFYIAIGDKDQALLCLERAYQQHSEVIQFLKVAPEFDPLRSDPRFQDLVRRAGLPL
jgi:TolB-like protein/DNA-binding winged helix-turn-helix (wHTH) protein/Tfp pilus assembly protein PilF